MLDWFYWFYLFHIELYNLNEQHQHFKDKESRPSSEDSHFRT